MSTAPSPPRRPPVFGPEPWEEMGGSSWSHWDRWFCAVAVADHRASLDQLEERLVSELQDCTGGREATESKLSHLADLRARLGDADLFRSTWPRPRSFRSEVSSPRPARSWRSATSKAEPRPRR